MSHSGHMELPRHSGWNTALSAGFNMNCSAFSIFSRTVHVGTHSLSIYVLRIKQVRRKSVQVHVAGCPDTNDASLYDMGSGRQ